MKRSIEKLRQWQRRSKPLKDGGPLERHTRLGRKTRLRPINRKRKAKRYAKAFGSKADWVRTLPCLVCGAMGVDPHHHPTRAAGGTSKDLTPLCRDHHNEYHRGAKTFMARYNLDLASEAEHYESAWQERVKR